jgi:hypothetical protein
MEQIHHLIQGLEGFPVILMGLLDKIPHQRIRARRLPGKWSIHEQVCHLIEAQAILMGRFRQFETESNPLITSYHPPADRPADHYFGMDFREELGKFPGLRSEMVAMLRGFPPAYWECQGRHEAFHPYNTRILLTHALNVDYAHLFSIEQLGLTKDGLEDEILTIP